MGANFGIINVVYNCGKDMSAAVDFMENSAAGNANSGNANSGSAKNVSLQRLPNKTA